jgi:hypothetical protein
MNHKDVAKTKIFAKEMEQLDLNKAHELFKQHKDYKYLLNQPIDSYTMSLRVRYPYQATLSISKVKSTNTEEQKDDDEI